MKQTTGSKEYRITYTTVDGENKFFWTTAEFKEDAIQILYEMCDDAKSITSIICVV